MDNPDLIHFATKNPDGKWLNLCGAQGAYVKGGEITDKEITCNICREKWRQGVEKVADAAPEN